MRVSLMICTNGISCEFHRNVIRLAKKITSELFCQAQSVLRRYL